MSEQKNGCAKISPLLDPYFEGVLSKSEERRVSEHLWQCPHCAAELEQVRRLAVLLNRAPTALPKAALAAAISARIATLPDPAARRRARGWKRLVVTEALVLAGAAGVWYAVQFLGPHFLQAAQPAFTWAAGTAHYAGVMASHHYGALLGWLGAAWAAAPSLGRAALRLAPQFARYLAMELALVAGLTFLLRISRSHAVRRGQEVLR